MALIAIVAVVDIAADSLMLRIRLALGMAVCAREHGIVRGIGMAGRTHTIGSAMSCWEPGVIEYRTQPGSRTVARLARSGETGRHMVRVGRALIVLLVAAVASRG